jgi:protein-L-isoaspartate(D-aspartate) O-methyltransferase
MMELPFSAHDMFVIRRAYARQMLAAAGIESSPRLEEALATVPRERFLGPPPWRIIGPVRSHEPLPCNDPAVLYQDVRIALAPGRGVNNGSPSLHARWLHALAPRDGERVAHIGAGTGYYTALLAHLVGDTGHVLAVEFDPALAELARTNLADRPNVTVVSGDGAEWPREAADGIYVNCSVERPAEAWIDGLRPGGRLVFPLGVPRPKPSPGGGSHTLHGAGVCVTREAGGLSARWLGPAFFVCAEGQLSQPGPERDRLKASFEAGGMEFVRSLIWREPVLPQRCWFAGSGWALSYDEASR